VLERWIAMSHDHVVRVGRRRWLTSSFTLALIVAGLTSGVLVLAAAAFLEKTAVVDAEDPWEQCVGFQVGSLHAADTHVHLANVGPERLQVRLRSFNDTNGLESPAIGYTPLLEPGASSHIVFRTPALGSTIELVSSVKNLHATVEIHRDDGAAPATRPAFLCLPRLGAASGLTA